MFKFFSTPRYLFNDLWSIEAIRIKETQWGLLDDEAEVRKAKSQEQGFEKRLLIRAQLLSKRLGWQKEQQKILLRARWLFWLWLLLAILVGVGAARAALGADSNQVNIFSAWLVLLLVPTLGLVFWLFSWLSYVFKPKRRFKLNRYWYWLANKMVRGPDAFILLQALFSVLQQQRKMFWLVSWVHHIFWLVALTSATIQLWVTFAFKRYSFFWETTILAPERFIQLAKSASSGLGWLGFNVPDESLIRLSDGLSALPVSGHALWASWLMSCVLIYGVLPRFVLFLISFGFVKRQNAVPKLDLQRPGLLELQPRLSPEIQILGVDAPSTPDGVPLQISTVQRPVSQQAKTYIVGMELAADYVWPINQIPKQWQCLGTVDSREQRQALITRLQKESPQHIVMLCDGQQTPDRGLMAWLVEVASYAAHQSIVVDISQVAPEAKTQIKESWQQRLEAAGFVNTVYFSLTALINVLK